MNFRNLPKVELHMHLDCSLSYEVVRRLRPGVSEKEYRHEYVAPLPCTNLKQFLDRSVRSVQLLQTEEALRLAVEDVMRQLAQDKVIYGEMRFGPLLHLENGLKPERVVEVVDRATEEMIRQTGVEARLILCTLRHYTAEQSMQVAKLVEQFRGSRVVALDIAGDEAGCPLAPHVEAFRFATEHGLHKTAHAGEAAGAASVWDVLTSLAPTRIGHGVRSIEDARLVEHLRNKAIHLEVCPSSNVQIVESIESWPEHPIDRLYRAGVRLNVNTDSRTVTPTDLAAEYEGMNKYFRWTEKEFLDTNLAALQAAFAEDEAKAKIKERLTAGYAQAASAD
jgi:adenosine deaminase